MPSVVCGSATACTVMPARRASAAVTGPMQTTLGLPATGFAPSAWVNPRTVDALVKVMASISPASSAARAARGSVFGKTVR